MLPKTNEGDSKVNDYLKSLEAPEVKPIPKTEKKEQPKNDENNSYEYSDKESEDDTQW